VVSQLRRTAVVNPFLNDKYLSTLLILLLKVLPSEVHIKIDITHQDSFEGGYQHTLANRQKMHLCVHSIIVCVLLWLSNFVSGRVCPYDYDIIQRSGGSHYADLPIRILGQSISKVEFTVGNTWTTGANDAVEQIFTIYPGDGNGTRFCHLDSQVVTMESTDTSFEAYCTPNGISIVYIYVRHSSFVPTTDAATIPECCDDQSGSVSPTLEYIAVLNCLPTCSEVEIPIIVGGEINDPFVIVHPTNAPSLAPSLSSAPSQSSKPSIVPSSMPSSVPTKIVGMSCPLPDDGPMVLTFEDGDVFDLVHYSQTNSVCALVEMALSESNTIIGDLKPVGRSYDGNPWDRYGGDYSSIPWDCGDNSCRVRLPNPPQGRAFVLVSYGYTHNLTPDDLVARFLEKTTFGPTRREINVFTSPGDWINTQFSIQASSHRQVFRERVGQWHAETSEFGLIHTSPCEKGARYRMYSILMVDDNRYLSFQDSPHDPNKLLLFVDGKVRNSTLCSGSAGDFLFWGMKHISVNFVRPALPF
jgi:hypothetical protein